jgi:hypothetical protein
MSATQGIIEKNQASLAKAKAESIQACPKVKVSCPAEIIDGETLTFTVAVEGGPKDVTLTYNWTVSAGAISSGQGTSVITLEETKELGGQWVTATVDVRGFDPSCQIFDSCTTTIIKRAARLPNTERLQRKRRKSF